MSPLQRLNQLIAEHALATARMHKPVGLLIESEDLFHPDVWFLSLKDRSILADVINKECIKRSCGLGDIVLTRSMMQALSSVSGAFGQILNMYKDDGAVPTLPPLNINKPKKILPMEAEEFIL